MSGKLPIASIAKKLMLALTVVLVPLALSLAHDYVPGETQKIPVLLKGGDIYTVSGPVMPKTDLLFENSRITAIGIDIEAPDGAEIIDASGMHVYPGLIAAYTSLGLTEIGAVRATNDGSEIGSVTPEVSTDIAYNPDSELLPSVRANGITTIQVVPGGALVRGQSNIMNIDGWTREDATLRHHDGMHLTWPRVRVITAWWMDDSAEEQKTKMAKQRKRLTKVFDDARAYMIAKEADPGIETDLKWEAMIPVFKKEMPLFIHANDLRQIEQAIYFAEKQGIRMILVGGLEAWKTIDLIKDKNIPLIIGPTQDLPMRRRDGYDTPNRLPYIMQEAGVTYCISRGARRSSPASWNVRNLPFQAGSAVAYGLTKEQAIRSITLSVAEILGIDDDFGSLEVGKKATIIISAGDIMDHLTHNVTHMWIEGRSVDLDNRHKELFRKYEQKPITK